MNGKRKISKDALLTLASKLYDKNFRRTLSNENQAILYTLEYIHYVDVTRKANERNKELKTFRAGDDFLNFYLPKGKKRKDISIQDCSNDTKFFRGVRSDPGRIQCDVEYYTKFQFLPPQYYVDIINEYVDVEMEY